MAPKKASGKLSGAAAPPSHRGQSPSHRANSKKKAPETPKKKAGVTEKAAKKKALDAVPEAVQLEPLADLLAPLQSLVDDLRTKVSGVDEELAAIPGYVPAAPPAAAEPEEVALAAPAERPSLVASPSFIGKRKASMRIWKSFASIKLSEMASSLEAALVNDEKLRSLFNNVDTDLGGSIDKEELRAALEASGKRISDDQLTHMFDGADLDGGGDIVRRAEMPTSCCLCFADELRGGVWQDFDEFADVIKGVKAAKAAFIIERGVRRHQDHIERARARRHTACDAA